jgi:hypothetical protein
MQIMFGYFGSRQKLEAQSSNIGRIARVPLIH